MIVLQRIAMSKKQSKRQSNKILKEGWIVHRTEHQSRKKHYWRLDTKSIIMYKNESTPGYYKVKINSNLKLQII